MTNAQTEARAIVFGYGIGEPFYDVIVDRITAALAAKDADLAEARADALKVGDKMLAEKFRAERAEAQLAEANKALERLGTFETFTVEGWGFAHPEITARVEFARRAREAQGGENG